ncbi:VOC family protein [Cognatishimia activa]|uniref:Glyoxalase-like domain-containing protein n=1 Tax=Cognatishimia activa TaxID=1715691 RepID=A0A0P1IT87_9RHOB|nr:VOC family protein [Cognatishimia activa]CUI78612.1 hypothetical protein TA5113_01464 [Cognatishimia activa]CUK26817.1 hypothetical protein TA5114_02635 [Cognatishimia activa]
MQLDHIVVAGARLDDAVAHIEAALGVSMQTGGHHVRYGTHNALMGLADGIYLEAIAIDPDATPQSLPRWFGLDAFSGAPRLISWAARVPDLPAAISQYTVAGDSIDMQRGDLRWRMAVRADGQLPLAAAFPSLLQWQVSPIPPETLPASGCALRRLKVHTPIELSSIPEVSAKASIQVLSAPALKLEAVFDTPHGERVLT